MFTYTTAKASLVNGIIEGMNAAPFQKRTPTSYYMKGQHKNKLSQNITLTPGYVTKDDMGTDGDDWPHSPIPYVKAPNYISSPLPAGFKPDDEVHVIWLSFFTNLMSPILKKLDPNTNFVFSDYRTDIDSNTMWNKFVAEKWAKQNPSYSGDFGDFASFVSHMRNQATHRNRDLFVFDSGDIHHGTGIADGTQPAGKITDPIFEKVKYDLMTPGNHELYNNELADTMYKTYAPRWGKRYLTSNVYFRDVHLNKTIPLGRQYTSFRGKYGTRVLAYGFMFNYDTPATNAYVEYSDVTVLKPWFLKSLKTESDIIVVIGHNPIRSPEMKIVIDAIRQAHPVKPILVFGGHNHVRDFVQYDGRAAGLSAGRYMETVGWMSVKGIRNEGNLTIHRRYLDANRYTYQFHSLSHEKQKFDIWRGEKITNEIADARRSLDVDMVLGKAPMDYFVSRVPFNSPQNINRWLATEVLETVLLPSRPYPGMVVASTGMVRYDIQKGNFTMDDAYAMCPYQFKFVYINIKASHARRLLESMAEFTKRTGSYGNSTNPGSKVTAQAVQWIAHPMALAQQALTPGYVTSDDYGTGGDDWPHSPIPSYSDTPPNVATQLAANVADDSIIDLVFVEYYARPLLKALKVLDPERVYTPTSYRTDIDLMGMFINFIKLKWN
ncbi:hypothetical protein BGZ73_005483 [Actinomortierella ambigua]|nr:hypothetical protein BGZ73_005483 [Actinomortierella ambigua]